MPKDRKEYHKQWYQKDKANQNSLRKQRVERNRQFLREYKEKQHCEDCLMTNPLCFDFHHDGDDKSDDVSSLVNRGYSIANIEAELAKCVCLCANCHRIRHKGMAWEQQSQAKTRVRNS